MSSMVCGIKAIHEAPFYQSITPISQATLLPTIKLNSTWFKRNQSYFMFYYESAVLLAIKLTSYLSKERVFFHLQHTLSEWLQRRFFCAC